jgi:hypothetical protein
MVRKGRKIIDSGSNGEKRILMALRGSVEILMAWKEFTLIYYINL